MRDTPLQEPTQTLEEAVARFIVDFRFEDIDPATLSAAKALIKDQFAIQIGAAQLPWSRQSVAFRQPLAGKATIVGEAQRARAVDAAYLNAAFGHGFEYDDFFGNAHPGCAVVPAAFALAEDLGASRRDLLTAMVVGYETYVRIGKHGSPEVLNVGWQPHAVFANFGVAALAAKLMGLDYEQTLHALAIALSHASGPTEYASTGGSIKRLHAGIAVRNGIEAAELARAGITGPRRFLTGNRGMYKMFCHKEVRSEALADFAPGSANFMPGLSFKAYCCCACTFAYIEAMRRIEQPAANIARVETRVQTMVNSIVGTRNANIYRPRNIEEVQYSLPAQMAMSALGLGNGFGAHHAVLEGRVDLGEGSELAQLIGKIEIEVSPDLDAKYRYFVADVTVHYQDGSQQHIFEEQSKGSPMKPFSAEDFMAKLSDLADGVIGHAQAQKLWAEVDAFDLSAPVSAITELLVAQNPARQAVA